jgi:hypothetical protein
MIGTSSSNFIGRPHAGQVISGLGLASECKTTVRWWLLYCLSVTNGNDARAFVEG